MKIPVIPLLLIATLTTASATTVGLGFGSASTYTTNWTRVNSQNITISNLINTNGVATNVAVTVGTASIGNSQRLTETASYIPTSNPAIVFPGNIYRFGDGAASRLTVTLTGLTPNTSHNLWLFAFRWGGLMTQEVTITGSGSPVIFSQSGTTDQVFINDTLGSTAPFSTFAPKTVTSNSSGEITVQIQDNGAANIAVLSGLIISDTPPPVATPISNTALLMLAGLLSVAGWWTMEQRRQRK